MEILLNTFCSYQFFGVPVFNIPLNTNACSVILVSLTTYYVIFRAYKVYLLHFLIPVIFFTTVFAVIIFCPSMRPQKLGLKLQEKLKVHYSEGGHKAG